MWAFGVASQLHPQPRRMRVRILDRLFVGIHPHMLPGCKNIASRSVGFRTFHLLSIRRTGWKLNICREGLKTNVRLFLDGRTKSSGSRR
jgi:hypothetical protein